MCNCKCFGALLFDLIIKVWRSLNSVYIYFFFITYNLVGKHLGEIFTPISTKEENFNGLTSSVKYASHHVLKGCKKYGCRLWMIFKVSENNFQSIIWCLSSICRKLFVTFWIAIFVAIVFERKCPLEKTQIWFVQQGQKYWNLMESISCLGYSTSK